MGLMSQWEYLFLSAEWADYWRPRWTNQRELDRWEQGPPLAQFLQQLGVQGWELVSGAPVTLVSGSSASGSEIATDYSSLELFFKRPKSSPNPGSTPASASH